MQSTTRKFVHLLLQAFLFWRHIYCDTHKSQNGPCGPASFKCNSSDLCIPQRLWCDESVQCPDGSDEADCVDSRLDEMIDKKYTKRPGAKIDGLAGQCNFAQKNETKPSGCQCMQGNVVCRHLQLQEAPPLRAMYEINATEVIDLLDLGGNSFVLVERASFQGIKDIKILNLVLQHCGIKDLKANSFIDLLQSGLEELHLDGNRLTHLHGTLFNVEGNSLRLLSIGHNSITAIDPETFWKLGHLIELDLSNNKLGELNAHWFTGLHNLTTLHLQGNLLTEIQVSSWLAGGAKSLRIIPTVIGPTQDGNSTQRLESAESTSATQDMRNIDSKDIKDIKDFKDNKDNKDLQDNNVQDMKKPRAGQLEEEIEILPAAGLAKLETLSLAGNRIARLQDDAFAAAPMARALINLDLSENRISHLSNRTFKGLSTLLVLKLNQNNLQHIHEDAFEWMPNLTSLNLKNNEFITVSPEMFAPLEQLHHLYFDTFEMCANAPLVKVCEPKGDGISSKEHLLDSIILRTSVWIMALIGFIGNSIVLLGRQFVTRHSNVIDSLHIKNLAISDLLMSLYLFAIAAVDEYYRGEYLINEFHWRHSSWCTLSGFLNTLSCESSVFILSLVTWDRYVSVTRPFPRNQLSFKLVTLRLVTLWSIAILIALLPVLQSTKGYFGYEFYNSNGVCLPLYLHNPYGKGWQYSIGMFVFINLTALSFICYAYLRMIKAIRVSTVACRSTQQTHERDRVAQHLGIIVFTDCLCWVPVIAIKMATLAGLDLNQTYRNFVYAFLAIYVMPINSALNPILYTFATPLFKKQLHKMAHVCCAKQRRPDGQSGYDTALSLSLGMLGSNGRRVLTYRSTQTSHTGSKNSWRKQPQAV